ncbi:phosphoribosylglycinamide formyltransferase [Photobacterium nomapromontoriensis]|uniref:phosphoribosylglycinamide formyltransferase n=1 Tax=Photobacterium nomapromontoriensis TaxID=2910237 RepID=UPI003D11D0DF
MAVKSVLRTCFILVCMLSRGTAVAAPTLMTDYKTLDVDVPSKLSETSKKSFQRSLVGLYSINSWRTPNIQQPYSQFDALYQIAPQAQQELADLVQEISLVTQTEALLPGVKTKDRAQYKIETELNGDASKITDLARASVVANDIPSLVQAFELMGKEATIVAVKNRFKSPAASGYRDLKVLVKLPKSEMIAEVQFHLDAISTVKNGEEHKIYEQIQLIERTAQVQNRDLSEFELAQINKLRATSTSLYHHAWQQYLQPSNIAV